jgi:hypothetical protein
MLDRGRKSGIFKENNSILSDLKGVKDHDKD